MKKLWTILRRVLLLLVSLLLIAVVGILLFLRTERFRLFAREQIVARLNDTLQGTFTLGRVESSLFNSLTLYDLTVTYQEVQLLYIPRLTAAYNLLSLLHRQLQITQVDAVSPQIHLLQDAQGNWTLLDAVSAKTPPESSEADAQASDFAIFLESLALTNGRIDVTLAGPEPRHYQLTDTNLQGRLTIKSDGTTVNVQQLTTQLQGPALPLMSLSTSLTFQNTAEPATVQVAALQLDTPHSHLRLSGEIRNLQTLDTNASLTIEKLATEEIKLLVPTWPLTQDLSGTLYCQGPLSDFHLQLHLAAAEAQVSGNIHSNFTGTPLTYEGTMHVKKFDVQKQLDRKDIAGVIDGTVYVTGSGTELKTITSKAEITVHNLTIARWQLGNVAVNGSLAQQQGTMHGTLASTFGQATWQGTIDLASAQPRYQVNLVMDHVNIQKTPTDMQPITSDLNLTAALSGQGFVLSEIDTQADVHLRPSTIGAVTLDYGRLITRIANNRIAITELTLKAKDTTVAVHGDIGTTREQSGQLTYAMSIGNVTPWLALLEQTGAGVLQVTGTAAGTLNALTLRGEIHAQQLQLATNALQNGSVTYQLENVGQPHPTGIVHANVQGIAGSVSLTQAEATITLPKNLPPTAPLTANVDLSILDAATRAHRLQGTAWYQPPKVSAHITEMNVETPVGPWALTQPTQLVQENDRIVIDRLRMANKEQTIELTGQAGLSGAQDLHLRLDRVALASLQVLRPQAPEIGGVLTLDARVGGTAAAPQLKSVINVDRLRVAGQAYAGVSATIGYDNQRATVALSFKQDATHALTANGMLPITISWANGWNMEGQGDMTLHARSSGLNLAFLNAFTSQAVKDIKGEFGLDVTVNGPVNKPRPQGGFTITDGGATVSPLGVQVEQVTVEGQITPETVRILQLSASSGAGRLTGSGALTLTDFLPQQVTLSISADHWPAIHTRQYQVEVDGQIEGKGPISQLQVTGALRVPEATLRPDLAFLTAQPVKRDATIVVLPANRAAESSGATTSASISTPPPPASSSTLSENLALDVTIRLPRNAWIKHHDADIELAGKLEVTKPPKGKPLLVGTINVVRGWLNLQGRRFTLTQGNITFTGGTEVNPSLNIIAQYQLPQYLVEAVVGGTLNKPTLNLRSEPTLEQADILALLVFGKPVSQLGQGEKTDFQQQALQMTGGYVAAQIANSVSQALGLEDLGLDLRQVDLTGGRIGFGRYVGPNTYISASQDLSGRTGHQVTVDYYLSPRWKMTTSSTTGGDNAAGITWQKQY